MVKDSEIPKNFTPIVFCDRAYEEGRLEGLIENLSFSKFPTQRAMSVIVVQAARIPGEYEHNLQIIQESTGNVINHHATVKHVVLSNNIDYIGADMAATHFRFEDLVFPEPGNYIFKFVVDNKVYGERSLEVSQAP